MIDGLSANTKKQCTATAPAPPRRGADGRRNGSVRVAWGTVGGPAWTVLSGRTHTRVVVCELPLRDPEPRDRVRVRAPSPYALARPFAERSYPDLLPAVPELQRRFRLTPREAQVALLLARRCTAKEIARELAVSHSTARRHAERVLGKLALSSRRHVLATITRAASDRDA